MNKKKVFGLRKCWFRLGTSEVDTNFGDYKLSEFDDKFEFQQNLSNCFGDMAVK